MRGRFGIVYDPNISAPNVASQAPSDAPFTIDSVVVGRSPRMRAVFDFVRVISDSESNVLIVGETGTGKEMIANLIHYSSRRRRRPFVAVSCAILTETLIESELFGHERGAFTGAIDRRVGRFELADKGTIFLDEVEDIPLELQSKLLRVLQEQEFERLGSSRTPISFSICARSERAIGRMSPGRSRSGGTSITKTSSR